MAKKTTRNYIKTKNSKKSTGRFQRLMAGIRRSPKKSLFIAAFALAGTLLVIGALALCPPPDGLNGRGPDGPDGTDETCIASSSNNNCSGTDGADSTGADGADGHGEDVITAPGTDGADGSSSADGADGTPSAPTSPGTPGAPATGGGTICTTRNGVKTCRNL